MTWSRARRMLTPERSDFRPRSVFFMLLVFLLGVSITYVSFILRDWQPVDRSNIGGVQAEAFLSYGPIDVVYTWVNGTDPRWKREKEFWHRHWIASLTGQPLPTWGHDADVPGKDDASADNRFRDNEELRYSLRSLEKYAPWVRHVYVVTDGQIPSWLDMASTKLSLIKHGDIFANASHLPVFSSPAIEWNLANIPGLSDMFLYFNDDVFLGAPVRPEDFVSQAGVQKGYFAWEIPPCAHRCEETSLANGQCDKECNVSACDYDMGDCGCTVNPLDESVHCDPDTVASLLDHTPGPRKIRHHVCQGMCQYHWLGNGWCDQACNVSSCAFDGGDCRVVHALNHPSSRVLDNEEEEDEEEEEAKTLSPLIKELWSAEVERNHTLVHVPLDVNATYVNLTAAFGVHGSIFTAGHDNDNLVRFALVYEAEMVLVLVFGRDVNANPMTSSVQVTINGASTEGTPLQLHFSIVRGTHPIIGTSSHQPRDLCSGMFTFQTASVRPYHTRLPFDFQQATFRHVDSARAGATALSASSARHETLATGQSLSLADSQALWIEVGLPFKNCTGPKVHDGDMVTLGWYLDLHLRADDKDWAWSDHTVCRFMVPTKPRATPCPGTKETCVEAECDPFGEQGGSLARGNPDETFEMDQGVEDRDARLPSCRLAEDNRGLLVTVPLPTRVELMARDDDDEEGTVDTGDTPTASDLMGREATGKTATRRSVDTVGDARRTRPQVVDGHLCFDDSDRADPRRIRSCFALAMGHYHATSVDVGPTPTLQARQHAARSVHDNPAWLELSDHCLDTTERYLGMRPPQCNVHEVPVARGVNPDTAAMVAARLQHETEVQGRRLACAAQEQRLAHAKAHETAARNAGLVDSLSRLYGRVKVAVGIGHVVPATESIETVAYANVCSPAAPPSIASTRPSPDATRRAAQAHLSKDTFGDSLRFVNKLYNRAFGKPKTSDRRRVPSHMPFLLQKARIRELRASWPHEIDATSAHRFRHPQDMQFSFSYFHYLINRAQIHPPTLQAIWHDYLDANQNDILDEDEVLTAASLAHGDAPPEDFVQTVRACLQPPRHDTVRDIATADGTVRQRETLTPYIRLEHLARCPSVREALIKNVRDETHLEAMPETEVTFHMLSDNYPLAWKQMMGTRARRTKFVCINDDMKFPSPAVSQILHELFLSMWPTPSQFELPLHLKNRHAHIDEYRAAHERRHVVAVLALGLGVVLALVFRASLWTLIRGPRAISASSTVVQHEAKKEGG